MNAFQLDDFEVNFILYIDNIFYLYSKLIRKMKNTVNVFTNFNCNVLFILNTREKTLNLE